MQALMKFMAKNKDKLGKFMKKTADGAETAGKVGLGATSLGIKGAGKAIMKKPKTAAALAAAAGVAAGRASKDDKKKKRPYETDEE